MVGLRCINGNLDAISRWNDKGVNFRPVGHSGGGERMAL